MKISIIGPAYPLRGGIAHHVYWLKQALIPRGHLIQVISFRKLYPSIFFPGTSEFDKSGLKLDADAMPLLTPLNPISWRSAVRQIERFSPDVVLIQWWQPFFGLLVGSIARWCRRRDVKCIIECHNIFPHESTPLDRPLLRFALTSANRLITHSVKDREDLLGLIPGKRIDVISLPLPGDLTRPGSSSRDGHTILFFGKVRKYKGLEVLLKAMPKVLATTDCRLVIAGEFYDSIDRYEELIGRLGIKTSVEIHNRYVPNEEVGTFFDKADVLVLPYLSASQSGVARIALLNGLPLIASTAGGLSEVIEENVNGLLFRAGDSSELADRLITYFGNNLGPTFSKTILNSLDENWNSQVADLIEVL